jgi:hypothetical protein
MSNLAATAERLRVVKDACVDFITLWAIDRLMEEDQSGDRIYGDILCAMDRPREHSILQSDRYLDD